MSSNYTINVNIRNLKIPHQIKTVDELEAYYQIKYPKIQIRFSGLQYGKFPHIKRIPYISVCVDGSGIPISADLHYL